MSIAYESGVNLFDTAEVYAGGRWVLYKPVFSVQLSFCVIRCRCPVSLAFQTAFILCYVMVTVVTRAAVLAAEVVSLR